MDPQVVCAFGVGMLSGLGLLLLLYAESDCEKEKKKDKISQALTNPYDRPPNRHPKYPSKPAKKR